MRNTFIIFLVSGFWHGANWTFICWGAYHALLFLPLILLNKNRRNIDVVAAGKRFPSLKEWLQMGTTFGLVVLGWILFRAESITQAWHYIAGIFSPSLFHITIIGGKVLVIILIFIIVEWLGRENQYAIERMKTIKHRIIRWGIYSVIMLSIVYFMGEAQQFIYFQF